MQRSNYDPADHTGFTGFTRGIQYFYTDIFNLNMKIFVVRALMGNDANFSCGISIYDRGIPDLSQGLANIRGNGLAKRSRFNKIAR